MEDTIFAIATAPIKSGVAIIRISGEDAFETITRLTDKPISPREATLRKLYHPKSKELIDEALVLWFPTPNSFTGENIVEIHIHGSKAVMSIMLELLGTLKGFRLAEPGEFSRRAFYNNKMDLTEAEGLADLIDAETKMQAKQALRQMQGNLKNLYEGWRTQLVQVLARLEAYIDFPDEEIPQDLVTEVNNRITALNKEISIHLNDNRRGEILRSGLNIVILGAPNVGKSSLLNLLAKREIAIVSEHAGTTRDFIEVHLDIDGMPITLIDTAGLRSVQHEIEKEGIRRAKQKAETSDLKVVMFSAADLENLDQETLGIIDEDTLIMVNKIDMTMNKCPIKIQGKQPILISVKENTGIDDLINKIKEKVADHLSFSEEPIITHQRYRHLIERTSESLSHFNIESDLELAAEDLRMASRYIGQITGRIDVEEILDELFSNFCIGK